MVHTLLLAIPGSTTATTQNPNLVRSWNHAKRMQCYYYSTGRLCHGSIERGLQGRTLLAVYTAGLATHHSHTTQTGGLHRDDPVLEAAAVVVSAGKGVRTWASTVSARMMRY